VKKKRVQSVSHHHTSVNIKYCSLLVIRCSQPFS